MNARVFRRFFLNLSLVFFLGCVARDARAVTEEKPRELSIYTYDSFVAKGGLGPEIAPLFEKACGCKLKFLASGDGGQLVTRLQIDQERGHANAQVVVGLDQATFERARPWIESWGPWTPKGMADLHADVKPKLNPTTNEVSPGFLPFDYGFFAFMADEQALRESQLTAPTRLSDLLKPEWKRNLILEDPRTSTPGLAFVLYASEAAGGEKRVSEVKTFWSKMRSQWLTLTLGWDSAYGLFMKKEAPLVWSYTTSQAYHEEHGDSAAKRRYRALIFEEGQPMQVEGAALVKGSFGEGAESDRQRRLAQSFLEFLISPEVQKRIALRNWMYPVRKSVSLPLSFKNVPRPRKVIRLPVDAKQIQRALSLWTQAVEGSVR